MFQEKFQISVTFDFRSLNNIHAMLSKFLYLSFFKLRRSSNHEHNVNEDVNSLIMSPKRGIFSRVYLR